MSIDVALSPIPIKDSIHSFESRAGFRSGESIVIYLSVGGGSVIPIRVLESDSIASVKLRIQTCKGFVVKNQKLVFGGRELARNNSLMKDYGVNCGDVLHLVLKLSDLLLITVRTIRGREFEFHVDRHRDVKYLKKKIFKSKDLDEEEDDDQEIFFDGERLDDDQRIVDDIRKSNEAEIHLVVQRSAKVRAKPVERDLELSIVAQVSNEETVKRVDSKRDFWLEPIVVNPRARPPKPIWDILASTFEGLEKGHGPIRSSEGTGGTYLMRDSSQDFVSVFKPIDEEPMAQNNPHNLPLSSNGEGLKRGTKVGEGAIREVAAYILDHPRSGAQFLPGKAEGFAGVPPTTMVRCLHRGFNHPEGYEFSQKNVKIGSLQMFVKNEGSCEDMGPGTFPVEEVHKISVLDIRMANTDRHAGNVLISKGKDGQTVLVPIDHGYCLPDKFEDCTFDWLYWPQAKKPYSAETIEYINSLDAEQDIALLRFHGWDIPLECARTLRVSTMLLKKGVQRGLTPFVIGNIMCRQNIKNESVIEEILREAQNSVFVSGTNREAELLEAVSKIMDSRLDELAK